MVEPIENFRNYLLVLARAHLGPRLKRRLSVSDIVQNTLLEAHRARELFRGETVQEQARWLRQILLAQIAGAHRHYGAAKRAVGREVPLGSDLERSSLRLENWLAAAQTSPSEAAARKEELLRMFDAFSELADEQQEILLLRFGAELPIADIAAELGVSANTASRRVRRGLVALRTRLKGSGEAR